MNLFDGSAYVWRTNLCFAEPVHLGIAGIVIVLAKQWQEASRSNVTLVDTCFVVNQNINTYEGH